MRALQADNARFPDPGTDVIKQIGLLLAALSFSCGTSALDIVPFQAEGFTQARAAGKVTAIQFHSGWCPVCIMQARGLKALKDDKALDQVTVFQADFFKEEALRKRFNVTTFSTLVIFKGEIEAARTTADSRPEQLKPLFAKAL